MSAVTIDVDTQRCVGSGTCLAIAPARFRFNDEDRSQPVEAVVDDDEDVRTAADMCPTAAITVREAGAVR